MWRSHISAATRFRRLKDSMVASHRGDPLLSWLLTPKSDDQEEWEESRRRSARARSHERETVYAASPGSVCSGPALFTHPRSASPLPAKQGESFPGEHNAVATSQKRRVSNLFFIYCILFLYCYSYHSWHHLARCAGALHCISTLVTPALALI